MNAAAYAIVGTAVGAIISGIVTVVNARIQASARQAELKQKERSLQLGYTVELKREKCQKYAEFLSSFWQEERFLSEMLENLITQRLGWSATITQINKSPEHRNTIKALNDNLGWLLILSEDETVEQAALELNMHFDRMMEEFACILEQARENDACNTASISQSLEALRKKARELSVILREDAQTLPERRIE